MNCGDGAAEHIFVLGDDRMIVRATGELTAIRVSMHWITSRDGQQRERQTFLRAFTFSELRTGCWRLTSRSADLCPEENHTEITSDTESVRTAVSLGLGFTGSPLSRIAATRLAAIRKAPICFGSSGMPSSVAYRRTKSEYTQG